MALAGGQIMPLLDVRQSTVHARNLNFVRFNGPGPGGLAPMFPDSETLAVMSRNRSESHDPPATRTDLAPSYLLLEAPWVLPTVPWLPAGVILANAGGHCRIPHQPTTSSILRLKIVTSVNLVP